MRFFLLIVTLSKTDQNFGGWTLFAAWVWTFYKGLLDAERMMCKKLDGVDPIDNRPSTD